MASQKSYSIKEVHNLLKSNYGFTKSLQTLRRTIDKMPNLSRDHEAGAITLFTNDDIRSIADHLGLKQKNYIIAAREQIAREEALAEEWADLNSTPDAPDLTFLYDTYEQFREDKLKIVRNVWQKEFYTLRQQLKTDAMFDHFMQSVKMTFDDDELEADLLHLDQIIDIGDNHDEELIAEYNEYMDKIHNYQNYVIIK